MSLQGKVALVTGGAHRVGKAIALGLARAGADVAISYHDSAAAAVETTKELSAIGVRALSTRCDVRVRTEVAALVAHVEEDLGAIDLLVASAAVFRRTPFLEVTDADWDFHLDANLRGPFLCAQAVASRMRSRGGAITFIADTAGFRPWASYLPYSISKAGVIALTRGLAIELAPAVRVNAIAPGPVLLPPGYGEEATRKSIARTLLRRVGSAEDVADAAVYLASATYVTGVVLPVDGGRHLG